MTNKTEIVFLLDRSGSMAGLECDTMGGFNAMIKKQQQETEGEVLVSTVLFDHESKVLHDRISLEKVAPLTSKDYEVRGMTALLDAVGYAINHIKNIHKYARAEDRPQKTIFIITTESMRSQSRSADSGKRADSREKRINRCDDTHNSQAVRAEKFSCNYAVRHNACHNSEHRNY